MSLADYAHHNEEAARIWYEEEGRHTPEPDYGDPQDDFEADRSYDAIQNSCPLADQETVCRAVFDRLNFDSVNLHSPGKPGSEGLYFITVEDRFGEGNAWAEVTIRVTVEGRA